MNKETLHLFASVPICGFRVAQAREYWETYPCPPPSTVYGMLLSLIGEPDRLCCEGAEIALALLNPQPLVSVVLRTMWRIKSKGEPLGTGKNKTPDFQEILSPVRLSIWVRESGCGNDQSLLHRLKKALEDPASVHRFGGLSLGESTHLVDEVRQWRPDDLYEGQQLVRSKTGNLSLPIWPDHVGSQGTRWGQFTLQEADGRKLSRQQPPCDEAWVPIRSPD